jgi:hypothetical protein
MKIMLPCIAILTILSACGAPMVDEPKTIVWKYLTKLGYHVVDVTELVTNVGNNSSSMPPMTLCQTAPYGAAFRVFTASGATVIGVACLEQDNTVTIPLQK